MFDHLSRLDPQGSTLWIELPMVGPDAAVEVRFAGESNRPYFNATLARAAKRARRVQSRGPAAITPEVLEENRNEDRELYPQHVLTGNWRGIYDQEGNPVECSLDMRREFCAKIPYFIFDQIRDGASNPARFLKAGQELPPEPAELAKN